MWLECWLTECVREWSVHLPSQALKYCSDLLAREDPAGTRVTRWKVPVSLKHHKEEIHPLIRTPTWTLELKRWISVLLNHWYFSVCLLQLVAWSNSVLVITETTNIYSSFMCQIYFMYINSIQTKSMWGKYSYYFHLKIRHSACLLAQGHTAWCSIDSIWI